MVDLLDQVSAAGDFCSNTGEAEADDVEATSHSYLDVVTVSEIRGRTIAV